MFSDKQKREMGGRIKHAIKAANKNQAWLARELHQTPANVSKMIKTGSVSLETLAQICLLLQCSMDSLVFGNSTKLPKADEQFIEQLRALMARAPDILK